MTSPKFPFKRIVRDRPYSQRILPTHRAECPIIIVPIQRIILTQTTLNIMGIFGQRFSHDHVAHVVWWQGEFYLEDGHHRVVMKVLQLPNLEVLDMRLVYNDLSYESPIV